MKCYSNAKTVSRLIAGVSFWGAVGASSARIVIGVRRIMTYEKHLLGDAMFLVASVIMGVADVRVRSINSVNN